MKKNLILLISVFFLFLLISLGYYAYTLREKNFQLSKLAAAVSCSKAGNISRLTEADKSQTVSTGPAELGWYKVADFLDLGKKDMFMLVENYEEYEALYCGANGKEVSGDYYLYYGTENDFNPEKKLSLGRLKFDSQQTELFQVLLNGQTHYVAVVQYDTCNSDIYRIWQIKKDDSFTPLIFDYGDEGRQPASEITVSFGHFSLGDDKVSVYTYWGAQPGDIADKTYYFSLYQDLAAVEKIITNYGGGVTGYDYYIDMEDPGPSAEKSYYLYSFKLPSKMNLTFQLRNMVPQFQMMLDDYMMFELAVGNQITYSDFANNPYKQAEYNGLKYYLYVYDGKYDWDKIFLDSFKIDGHLIFKNQPAGDQLLKDGYEMKDSYRTSDGKYLVYIQTNNDSQLILRDIEQGKNIIISADPEAYYEIGKDKCTDKLIYYSMQGIDAPPLHFEYNIATKENKQLTQDDYYQLRFKY